MITIHLITVGKLKEKYLRDACEEYKKRLSTLCNLKITELSPEPLSDNPKEKEIEKCLETEGKKILEKIPRDAYVITMCIEGKQMSSENLSEKIDELAVNGISNIVFVIGGSFGLSDEVKQRSGYKLSMSKMTFPHQLARVMLLEQIYRARQISSGSKYHK